MCGMVQQIVQTLTQNGSNRKFNNWNITHAESHKPKCTVDDETSKSTIISISWHKPSYLYFCVCTLQIDRKFIFHGWRACWGTNAKDEIQHKWFISFDSIRFSSLVLLVLPSSVATKPKLIHQIYVACNMHWNENKTKQNGTKRNKAEMKNNGYEGTCFM